MKTRTINRLWNGYASLRDYEVKEAIADGGVILKLRYSEETMTLFPKSLEQGIQTTKNTHNSKFNTGQMYTLIDFQWRADRQDEDQKQLEF